MEFAIEFHDICPIGTIALETPKGLYPICTCSHIDIDEDGVYQFEEKDWNLILKVAGTSRDHHLDS